MEASDENDLLELADCTGEKDNLVATENRSNWKNKKNSKPMEEILD
jgi:hypothetical protein